MATTYNTIIDQNADWYLTVTWNDSSNNPINLTGYSAALQFRTSALATTTALSLTSGSGITLGGSAGTIAIHATASQTATLSPGSYAYDLEMISGGGVVTRLISGTVLVNPAVTR